MYACWMLANSSVVSFRVHHDRCWQLCNSFQNHDILSKPADSALHGNAVRVAVRCLPSTIITRLVSCLTRSIWDFLSQEDLEGPEIKLIYNISAKSQYIQVCCLRKQAAVRRSCLPAAGKNAVSTSDSRTNGLTTWKLHLVCLYFLDLQGLTSTVVYFTPHIIYLHILDFGTTLSTLDYLGAFGGVRQCPRHPQL